MQQDWPFTDPKNVAVFSTRSVVSNEKPILYVSHDLDDGAWQFHSGKSATEDEPKIISLERIVIIDPSVKTLADLPLGWVATRRDKRSAWQRFEKAMSGSSHSP
ncbi:MAG: hypothetical protein AAGF66_18945 [Cyanobacteria bacterium P01_H01_bin.119]